MIPSLKLPNLPGFTTRSVKDHSPRTSLFDNINGHSIERPPPSARRNIHAFRKMVAAAAGATAAGGLSTPVASPPVKSLDGSNFPLTFHAYFLESVIESATEKYIVRKCNITFYADNTVSVYEMREENSGIMQGTFLKRGRVVNSDTTKWLVPTDLKIGGNISFNGRTFRVVNADHLTRKSLGLTDLPESYPAPPAVSAPEVDSTISKSVSLGKVPANTGLKRFLEHDRHVLHFNALYKEGMDNGHAEEYKFVIHYFLADNSLEILEVREKNSGRDNFPAFLQRCKVFKKPSYGQYTSLPSDTSFSDDLFLQPWDMKIGESINILGRHFLLYASDDFTKVWYLDQGIDISEDLDVSKPRSPPRQMVIPPNTGIGSEEDSLGSCSALLPKPPRRDMKKLLENDSKILRYRAVIDDTNVHNEGRDFVLSYFLADDTVGVFERSKRNSGRDSGRFLKRIKLLDPVKNSPTGYYTHSDIYIGAVLKIKGLALRIVEADEYTVKYNEAASQPQPGGKESETTQPSLTDSANRNQTE